MYTTVEKPLKYNLAYHCLFEKIVANYQTRILRYIQGFVGDSELSADILQDTFLGVYATLLNRNKIEELAGQTDTLKEIQPLIYTIARNKSLDELRKRKRKHINFTDLKTRITTFEGADFQEELDPAIEFTLINPSTSLEMRTIMSEELKNAINQIGRQRLISLFLHLDGYSYREIGQITGDNMASVKSKIYRSKQSLRQVLEKTDQDHQNNGVKV